MRLPLTRRARRRVRLNRALHELRRPIQLLALLVESGRCDIDAATSWMEQLRGALADLDAEINGRPQESRRRDVRLASIADALESRWRKQGVTVEAADHRSVLSADPRRLGAALDNLIVNAVAHGGGEVTVRALTASGSARLEVRDAGGSAGPARGAADPRHGHGLALAADVARDHGGTLIPPRRMRDGGTTAALSLPLAEPGARVRS